MSGDLSFVFITKNLEWNITRAIDSAFRTYPELDEVVVVDSASTDATVELVEGHPQPVKLCVLSPDQRLTAAAGRWVGEKNTTSEYIAFVDGDCQLLPGFVEQAVAVLDANPEVGIVGGRGINVEKDADVDIASLDLAGPGEPVDVFSVSGQTSVVRRTALEAAGSFSPRVISDEEPAMCVRMRNAGYRVVRIDHAASLHRTDPLEEIRTLLLRRGRNLWIGSGQNIREFWGTGMLGEYLRERGHGIAPAAYLAVLVASVAVTLVTGRWRWIGLVAGASVLGFVALALSKRSLHSAAYTVVKRFIILEGTVKGLMDTSVPAATVELEYEVRT